MDWSETEEKLLRDNYTKPMCAILKLFPRRTEAAIRGKIYRLGFSRREVAREAAEELQKKFCDGCPTTYNDDCPVTKAGKTWTVCNWKATYKETGVWGATKN